MVANVYKQSNKENTNMDNFIDSIVDHCKDFIKVVILLWLIAAPFIAIYFMIKGAGEHKWFRRFAQLTFLFEILVWALFHFG